MAMRNEAGICPKESLGVLRKRGPMGGILSPTPMVYSHLGMNGIDGGGKRRIAGREAPSSLNQRNPLSAKSTDYAAMPLAA